MYKLSGVLKHGDALGRAVTVGDSVVFSAANLVTLAVRDVTDLEHWGAAVQTVEAVSTYFVLGYVIWSVPRSVEG